jgi:hypothetical protein
MPKTLLSVYARRGGATEPGFGLFLVFFPAVEMAAETIRQEFF